MRAIITVAAAVLIAATVSADSAQVEAQSAVAAKPADDTLVEDIPDFNLPRYEELPVDHVVDPIREPDPNHRAADDLPRADEMPQDLPADHRPNLNDVMRQAQEAAEAASGQENTGRHYAGHFGRWGRGDDGKQHHRHHHHRTHHKSSTEHTIFEWNGHHTHNHHHHESRHRRWCFQAACAGFVVATIASVALCAANRRLRRRVALLEQGMIQGRQVGDCIYAFDAAGAKEQPIAVVSQV
jgi:hypothetical protein